MCSFENDRIKRYYNSKALRKAMKVLARKAKKPKRQSDQT